MDYPYANGYQQQAYTPQQYQYNPGNPLQQQQWQQPRQQMQMASQQLQPQSIPATNTLVGRVINSESDLRPDDITSDGYMSWYPAADGSFVIGRKMLGDGSRDYTRYVPEAPKIPEPTQSDRIEEKLNKLLTMLEDKEAKVEEVAEDAK